MHDIIRLHEIIKENIDDVTLILNEMAKMLRKPGTCDTYVYRRRYHYTSYKVLECRPSYRMWGDHRGQYLILIADKNIYCCDASWFNIRARRRSFSYECHAQLCDPSCFHHIAEYVWTKINEYTIDVRDSIKRFNRHVKLIQIKRRLKSLV